ncbi:hypothetical protein OLMES_0232 [Oleiphilus messinensis]|uniref:Uncharacterized protein n=1 Tax=Oleiphilus messinensis TaxID=141451 RepID=A0A1Y0I1J4_9GAMM|nr:hypothetical protein [Oleiphilus messinensis]ARU54338.1 hypothetical protein OLMES_0232 [Oleiphilus messinensis]
MPRQVDLRLTENGYQITRSCESRNTINSTPRDITETLGYYLPLDGRHKLKFNAKNFVGMDVATIPLQSGNIYKAFDGKRLIYEVGCESVVYLMLNQTSPNHLRFYLQPIQAFLWDISGRDLASRVTNSTRHIETIVKYEMYFLLGMISTISIPMLVMVTGSDITVSAILASKKARAAIKLSEDISSQNEALKKCAPTLQKKLQEFITAESKIKWGELGNRLPENIITDEKTQAQFAGVLAGKATLSPNAFTAWTAVFTVLSTAAIKSVTKSPETYGKFVSERYGPITNELSNTNWQDPREAEIATMQLLKLLQEAGVNVTQREMLLIIQEITTNPLCVSETMQEMSKSFTEFNKAIQ